MVVVHAISNLDDVLYVVSCVGKKIQRGEKTLSVVQAGSSDVRGEFD